MKDDQLYISLYIEWKRLMSLNARKNKARCDILNEQLRDLRVNGEVSEQAIYVATYQPWRR